MKIAMTLVVRDEIDVIDIHLAFHLAAGVGVVLVTDHRSEDGTSDVLERYAGTGRVRVFREQGEHAQQGAWVTRMARLAATEHDADWVLHSDADEFWWPRGSSLQAVLAPFSDDYGAVDALQRTLLPVADNGRPFWERMTVRLAPSAGINDPGTPYRPVSKIAHRACPSITVTPGNHSVVGHSGTRFRGCPPLEVIHVPLRSRRQCASKYRKTWTGWERNLRGDLARVRGMTAHGRAEAYYDRVALDEELVARGLAHRSLVSDTRLREAVRVLVGRDGTSPATSLEPPRATAAEARRFALDSVILEEANIVRLQREADRVATAVASFESRRATTSR